MTSHSRGWLGMLEDVISLYDVDGWKVKNPMVEMVGLHIYIYNIIIYVYTVYIHNIIICKYIHIYMCVCVSISVFSFLLMDKIHRSIGFFQICWNFLL